MRNYCFVEWVRSLTVIFLSLDLNINVVLGEQASVKHHLELGKKSLQEGQLSDALYHYAAAIDGDPSNYMIYFKRAAVYLAMGQAKKAIPDLDKSVELKKDFHHARLQRANTLLRLGKLDEASKDFEVLAESGSGTVKEDAIVQLQLIPSVKGHIDVAHRFIESNDFYSAIEHLGQAVEVCPWDVKLREMRAQCYESANMYQSAVSDLKMTTKLINDNTEAFYRISNLYYSMGEEEDSLREIRECLKLDPDHKTCFPFYKKIKKLEKKLRVARELVDEEKYTEGAEKYLSILDTDDDISPFVLRIRSSLCHCYSKLSNMSIGKHWCGLVLELDPDNVDALCDRAELFVSQQMYEEAIKDYQKAKEVENHPQKVDEGLQRAQKLLKQSQKRDYYKILGVKRTATKSEISKAYRKLARKWHPDSYDGEDQEKAEKMFLDIAAAKEVLTDPEMRQKFDDGEDPLDPEQKAGGFQHPFGGFPFGNGQGFTFKFKWN